MSRLGHGPETKFEYAYELLINDHTSKTPESLQQSALRRTRTINDMHIYLRRTNLGDYDNIPLIHITGTKGKGSTAALSESILRNVHNYRTGLFTSPHLLDVRERIRLDGRPVSEEEFADAYFTLRESLLNYAKGEHKGEEDVPILPGYFRMLTLMAIYIFTQHVYPPNQSQSTQHEPLDKGVDIIIMEVGMGGRYDATNFFHKSISGKQCVRPFVAGVTLIDFDHTRVLGNTLEKIAWEKGGIFRHINEASDLKTGDNEGLNQYFFTIETNSSGVIKVLQNCCFETNDDDKLNQQILNQNETLYIVKKSQQIPSGWKIGLKGEHQRLNAELALAMCQSIHSQIIERKQEKDVEFEPHLLKQALEKAFWPGRCQTVTIPGTSLMLHCDGAHTVESMKECVKWLHSITDEKGSEPKRVKRYLIFNCSHERNPIALLNFLVTINDDCNYLNEKSSQTQKKEFFFKVFFCRSDSERPSMVAKASALDLLHEAGYNTKDESSILSKKASTWQDTLAKIWIFMRSSQLQQNGEIPEIQDSVSNVVSNLNVQEALKFIKSENLKGHDCVHVCVTGSLYIVGSALNAVGWKEASAPCSHVVGTGAS